MSIGIGIFLIVVGAIIAFALPGLNVIDGANWEMIGYILILAGAIVTIISLFMARSRKSKAVTTISRDAAGNEVRATEAKDSLPRSIDTI